MKKLICLLALHFLWNFAMAQQGSLDLSFNPADHGYGHGDGPNGTVNCSVLQSDGKAIIGGIFQTYNTDTVNYLTRLQLNGSLDPTFNTGNGLDGSVNVIGIQTDGKIIVGGQFSHCNDSLRNRLVRLNADGSVDVSFQIGSGFNLEVTCLVVQSDGKIVVGGKFTTYNNLSTTHLIRLNTDGSVDNSFNVGSGLNSFPLVLLQQPDEKIIIGGTFTTINSVARTRIARLESDGSLDLSFQPGGGFNNACNQLKIQPDGKIIVVGYFTSFNGTTRNGIARLETDGLLDASFDPGSGFNNACQGIGLQADGKIIVVGYFTTFNGITKNRIARLNTDGTVDNSFTIGTGSDANVITCTIEATGKIIFGGSTLFFNDKLTKRFLGRLNTDGTLDTDYNKCTGTNLWVFDSFMQTDGKAIVTGLFTGYNGYSFNGIVRIDSDGIADTTFLFGEGPNPGTNVYGVSFQPDNKLIVSGNFTSFNGTAIAGIARIHPNGSIDPTFNAGTATPSILKTLVQPDGKILVAGYFTSFNGSAANRVLRLNANGSPDPTFNIGSGPNNTVANIKLLPNGKILLTGSFTTFNGVASNKMVFLNSNGSVDASFSSGFQSNASISEVDIQPDGKLMVIGQFMSYNGVDQNGIVRLNTDGLLDNSFYPNTSLDTAFFTDFVRVNDSLVLLTGAFDEYQGVNRNQIVRVFNNGTIDPDFDSNSAPDNPIYTTSMFQNGDILIGGVFTSCNSNGRNRLAKISNCNLIATTSVTSISCFGESDGVLTVNASNGTLPYSYFCSSTGSTTNILSSLTGGIYEVTITDAEGCEYSVVSTITEPNPIENSFSASTCSEYVWNSQSYNSSGTYQQILNSITGCDSIVTLSLTINSSTTGTDTQTACDSYEWIDGNTYTSSTNTPTFTLTNSGGCDSVVALNLTILPSIPTIIENTFSMPSDANDCVGEFAVDISGNTDFELIIDNGAQTATSSGYSLFSGLCAGVHDLQIINFCGDTTETQFVIPVDSNYVFTNPFIDSLAQDSLGTTIENCDIYYAGIDTAYIDSIWATGNTVNVLWNIVDSNGSNLDTTSYELNNGNGVYWLQLSVFCPTKALGDYFTVTEAVYFEDGTISTAGIWESITDNFVLYPNPTNDLVTIEFDSTNAQYTIYDAQGKLIQTATIPSGGTVSLKDVETGVYFFELTTENGKTVKRVVKN